MLLIRKVLIDLPPRLLALVALAWLGLVLFLYRRRLAHSNATGAEAATRILTGHGMLTRVVMAPGVLVDCYLPQTNTVSLGERTFHGNSIGALAVAAHEAGHALQHGRWYLPWCVRELLAVPAGIGLISCLWVWFLGMVMEDQRVLWAATGLFGLYMLFLLAGLVCEVDASRRGVRELIVHGLLDNAEAKVARRILRSALATYLAAFVGSTFALWLFASCLDWTPILDRLPIAADRLAGLLPQR